MIYILNSKRIIKSTMEELISKIQFSPKIIATSSHQAWGLHKRISLHVLYCCPYALKNKGSHHRYQPHGTKIARVEFIIKEINTKIK